MKKIVSIVLVALVLVFGLIFFVGKTEKNNATGEILSQNGLHWHSKLTIYVQGEKIAIPADIGLGVTHSPVHTHSPDGEIHLEFPGFVRKDETKLGEFFKMWKKDIRSFGENMHMTVNGENNLEYENYYMRDGDVIELYYQ